MSLFGIKPNNNKYEITLHVKGMMCSHCEAMVNKALDVIPGIISHSAAAATGEVRIIAGEVLSEEMLAGAVTGLGYQLIEYQIRKL